ncbi:MAG: type I-E CRISPR-associated protein Cse2/CasB [Leptospiraceae bacterium]|nr:type I-E CRISPR-associated protein Cse2/CasB [Leptospiraceae bacterium]
MKEGLFQTETTQKALKDWWESLNQNKGAKADLRKCTEPNETIYIPQTHALITALSKLDNSNIFKDRIGAVCGLVAHVKEPNFQYRIAQQMSAKSGSDKAVLSDLRFRRIIQCGNLQELYPYLIRVIRLLDGRVNIYSLAESVYYWGDHTKKNWAYDYYGSNISSSENTTKE